MKGTLYTNNFAVDGGILFLSDMKVKARILDRGATMEKGTQISFAAWKSDVITFEECFFTNVERWVRLYGLPYHLWSVQNFTLIGSAIGEAVAVNLASADFSRLDAACSKFFF